METELQREREKQTNRKIWREGERSRQIGRFGDRASEREGEADK